MRIIDVPGIQSLIDSETPESSSLEYKAAPAISNAKEIAKDVSAMANGAGGIIIYGLTEKDNKPGQMDPIKEKKFSREYLDQVIGLGIKPPIKFKIEPIPLGGGHIYAVHIEAGETAHMALEQYRYYRRYNFIAVPMEDYEIRDVMNRSTHPKLKLTFRIDAVFSTKLAHLDIAVENVGNKLAKHVKCVYDLPINLLADSGPGGEVIKNDSKVSCYRFEYDIPGVLHRGNLQVIKSHLLDTNTMKSLASALYFEKRLPKTPAFEWSIFADDAEPMSGENEFEEIFKRADVWNNL